MFCVVAHHSRREQAERLAYALGAQIFMDPENHGSNWNHRRAIEWASEQDSQVIVLEDDALPVKGFDYLVYEWIQRFPNNIISFYLGTGRPPQKQLDIAMRLIDTDKTHKDYISLPKLIHGVCYTIPKQFIPSILLNWDVRKGADYAISDKYKSRVIYPVFSLVDHADQNIVEVHPDGKERLERRRAWRLYEGGDKWPG